MKNRILTRLFCFLLLAAFVVPTAEAQLGSRIKDRIKRNTERRIENGAVRAADQAIDVVEDAIVCSVTDERCIEEARAQGQEPTIVDAQGEPVADASPPATATPASTSTNGNGSSAQDDDVWANYDFVPGDTVLYFHDFEGTRTGNFPSRLDYIAGNLDVVRLGSGEEANKVLRIGEGTSEGGPGGNGCFTVSLPKTLPDRFTLEFRLQTTDPLRRAEIQIFSDGSDDSPDTRCNYPPNPHIFVNQHEQGLQLPGGYGAGKAAGNVGIETGNWMSVALGCDGEYCKMYADGVRVANVPRYEFPRAEKLHVFMNVYRYSLYLDDLRIAEGGVRSLYDDLVSNGFFATTGILFDTGSATLRPESNGVLNEVLILLEDHGDVRLRVEGHTDNTGSDQVNLPLSEARAEAVKTWLTDHGVSASRLETAGFGSTRPVVENDTPENRQQNRRSEFHLLD